MREAQTRNLEIPGSHLQIIVPSPPAGEGSLAAIPKLIRVRGLLRRLVPLIRRGLHPRHLLPQGEKEKDREWRKTRPGGCTSPSRPAASESSHRSSGWSASSTIPTSPAPSAKVFARARPTS